MPRGFTDFEKEAIKKRLQEVAVDCLARYGIRKTTIDELTVKAGIAKGSFYQFYESKEMLFLEVIYMLHDEIQDDLLRSIETSADNITPDKLTELILGLFTKIEASFIFNLMVSGELDHLIRMVPDDRIKTHTVQDDLNMEKLLSLFPEISKEKLEIYSAALRGVFLSSIFKREIGKGVFPEALQLMIHGIVIQMFAEENGIEKRGTL